MTDTDPFTLLGLPRTFDLDAQALQRAYLARAARLHPDLSGLPLEESEAQSARLNEARTELVNPERRADRLLTVLGGPTKEADKALPAGFLMEIMETREAVEEALASKDPAQRAHWQNWAADQRAKYIDLVRGQFAALTSLSDSSERSAHLKAIRQTLNAWRYIERLIEQLDPAYNPAKADFR